MQPKTLPSAKMPPVQPRPPMPKTEKIDPITKEPLADGQAFDLVAEMKRRLQAKEKEMLAKEKEDPSYKPLSPTAHKPAGVPVKDKQKL